ncbi:MAG: TolC family protein [Bacteroidota bacterium]
MRIIYSLLLLFSFVYSSAQPLPTEALTFEDFLVDLAWKNHPTKAIYEQKINITESEISQAKTGYWDALLPFVNFTGGALAPNIVPDAPNVVGGLGFGLSFRLRPLYSTEHEVAIAKANKEIADLELTGGQRAMAQKIKSLHGEWSLAKAVADQRLKVETESRENQKLVLELFRQNAAEYEDVNNASTAFQKALEDRLRAEMDIRLAAIALEEWIGMTLEAAQLLYASR